MKFSKILVAMALCLTATTGATAQNSNTVTDPNLIQVDPNVRIGKLDNGLTYYIRHNEWPEDRAEFYIAQKVGSVQEEDHQKGLAHFLEHMCFNGTKNFPGSSLKTWLESIGVKFGENLNAYTSFDETVYNISNVPCTREGVVDSCLLILHDWSNALLLEEAEIDKERGVINEEWRTRRSAVLRMYEASFPELYRGSRYSNRMPIGTMDVVLNFKYDDLRSYYHKWYRPDLQGIVVVGDIDVDQIEKKIKDMFSHIKMPANPAKREYYPVPDNKEPIVDIQKDKEQEQTFIYLMLKHEVFPDSLKGNIIYSFDSYINSCIGEMFGTRFREILQQENAPFLSASVSVGNYFISKTKGALDGVAVSKDNAYKEALSALYREILRAGRYGFTASEYERCRQGLKASLDNIYAQKDKVYSSSYVNSYVRHFLDNEPIPSIEWECENMRKVADMVTVEHINQKMKELLANGTDSNMVLAMFCPDKPDYIYPTEAELLNVLAEVDKENIEPYKEEISNEPLISDLRAPGKVVKTKKGPYGSTHLTLENGVNIYVLKTDYTPNAISMNALSDGGMSLYSLDEYMNSSNAGMVGVGGWGNFKAIDLGKKLAGKQASASPSIGTRRESISGGCVKKDIETMLQLTYLMFTSPRKDETAYNAAVNRYKASISNQEMDPMTALSDTIAKVMYNNHPTARRVRMEDLEKMNYDRIIEIYKERFADANDFTFFFVGDIDVDSVAPLFEKYIGSLPVLKSKEKYGKSDKRVTKGEVVNVFEKEQETPQARIRFYYHAPLKSTAKNSLIMNMLQQAMTMLYTETVREQEGGAYGIPVSAGINEYPEKIGAVSIVLPTSPDKREYMTKVIYKGIDEMIEKGPKAEDLQKIKEYLHRSYAEGVKTNGYWMSQLINNVTEGEDLTKTYEKLIDEITGKDIQKMAKKIFRSGNRLEIGMTGVGGK